MNLIIRHLHTRMHFAFLPTLTLTKSWSSHSPLLTNTCTATRSRRSFALNTTPAMCEPVDDAPASSPSVRRSSRRSLKTSAKPSTANAVVKKAVPKAKATKSKPTNPKKKKKKDDGASSFVMGYDAEKKSCSWSSSMADYMAYHDTEWGTPLYDDAKMFEFLLLETFQAGLNWLLILRKRENFRRVFHGFDLHAVADMTEDDVQRLLEDASIIRHAGKIRAAINNARVVLRMKQDEGVGLAHYFWNFVDYEQVVNDSGVMPTRNALSDAVAKDMKKRGFKFVGSTTMYSHLQVCHSELSMFLTLPIHDFMIVEVLVCTDVFGCVVVPFSVSVFCCRLPAATRGTYAGVWYHQ